MRPPFMTAHGGAVTDAYRRMGTRTWRVKKRNNQHHAVKRTDEAHGDQHSAEFLGDRARARRRDDFRSNVVRHVEMAEVRSRNTP